MKINKILSKPLRSFSLYASERVEYEKQNVIQATREKGNNGVVLILSLPVMISKITVTPISHMYIL